MKTNMDVRSLGESDANYTNSSVRQANQRRSSSSLTEKSSGSGAVAAGLIAGASVGVLAGILLAPKTGKDMRKQVTDSATKLSTQANELYNSSREKVTSWTGKGRSSSSSNASTHSRVGTSPNSNDTQSRNINNDPATSITM
jgi:gas vesicle protein